MLAAGATGRQGPRRDGVVFQLQVAWRGPCLLHPPSFPRRRESMDGGPHEAPADVTVDSRLRGNDESGLGNHRVNHFLPVRAVGTGG
jgi:hypothetical protein